MSTNTLIMLAEFSFDIGLISHNEYVERYEIALWLATDNKSSHDPRVLQPSELRVAEEENLGKEDATELSIRKIRKRTSRPNWLEFSYKKWIFTKADPDDYPSTPHGHLENPNHRWPKLNPYTGRAFNDKHIENVSLRLKKTEMRELWQDESFRDFCRSYILWYMERFPYHSFPATHPLRLPKW